MENKKEAATKKPSKKKKRTKENKGKGRSRRRKGGRRSSCTNFLKKGGLELIVEREGIGSQKYYERKKKTKENEIRSIREKK